MVTKRVVCACKGSEPGFGCIFYVFFGKFWDKVFLAALGRFFLWTIKKIEFGFSVNDMGVSKK